MIPNYSRPKFNPQPKPEKSFPKAKKPLSRAKKVTGERDLFIEISKERPHVCVKCHDKIENIDHNNFDHIKPKSTHPELRLDKSNIQILCESCHYEKHFVAKDKHKKPPLTPQ